MAVIQDLTLGGPLAWAIGVVVALLMIWLAKVNYALSHTPPEVLRAAPTRWTRREILEVFGRMEKKPVVWEDHLPPMMERRYIVIGGGGLVGGEIILQLLARGHPPEAIRIVDLQRPKRHDMKTGLASQVHFVQADITFQPAVEAAFSEAWPESVAALPLTVFHTAAVIRPSERSPLLYERCQRPNVDGTIVCVAAARRAKAEVFVATSSSVIGLEPMEVWGRPFTLWPKNYTQTISESDFFKPLREPERFYSNYSRSKAEAERLVCAVNDIPLDPSSRGGFRTGTVRPGNLVYGHRSDLVVNAMLRSRGSPTFNPRCVQNWVHVGNVALAHLQYEAALLSPHARKVGGRPFLVTDGGPPPMFEDFYEYVRTTCVTPFHISYLPPGIMLVVAHVVEAYCLALARFPVLRRWLSEPGVPLYWLQPCVFTSSANVLLDDSAARAPVALGGLGYRPAVSSMEGFGLQVVDWNRVVREEGESTT